MRRGGAGGGPMWHEIGCFKETSLREQFEFRPKSQERHSYDDLKGERHSCQREMQVQRPLDRIERDMFMYRKKPSDSEQFVI